MPPGYSGRSHGDDGLCPLLVIVHRRLEGACGLLVLGDFAFEVEGSHGRVSFLGIGRVPLAEPPWARAMGEQEVMMGGT